MALSSGRNPSDTPVRQRNHNPADGSWKHEQLRELVAHALRAHDLHAAVQLLDRGHELGVGLERERRR